MLFFTLAPFAALFASAALALRHGPSGPMSDAQLPFLGAGGLDGANPGTFAVSGLVILPGAFEPISQYMIPRRGVLRSILVKNVVTGDDGVSLTYRVRIDGKDVGLLSLRNNDAKPAKLNITQVAAPEGSLVSVLLDNPGFPGTAPLAKIVVLWRPL